MHKFKEKKYFTHNRFVRVWVTPTPFPWLDYWDLRQGLDGNRCKLTTMSRGVLQSYVKFKMFCRPSVEDKQSRKKNKQAQGDFHNAQTQKKLSFVLHLPWSTFAETSRAQIDFLLFGKETHDLFPLKAKIFSVDAKLQRRVIWLMKE